MLIKYKIKWRGESMLCPKETCIGQQMLYTGQIVKKNIITPGTQPKIEYVHRCEKCGHQKNYDTPYPRAVWERMHKK